MLRAQLSIIGIYHWNSDVFDGFQVPENMNKDICITEILSQCSELELVYPSYDVMKELITSWSKIELPIWERVYKDCTMEYNPIWNKDGTITETVHTDMNLDRGGTGTVSRENEYDDTTIDSTKGYNSNEWAESEKSDFNHKVKIDKTTDSPDYNDHNHGWVTTERIEKGNIGVTTTQFMLESDLNLLPRLNPYQYIVDSFRRRFCLLVY